MGKLRSALPSPAMVVALVALAVSLSGTAIAANGGNVILGKANTATAQTGLTANRAGKALQITNTSTGTGATPLGLTSAAGQPPFTTNSATKVANLNADLLDGVDSTGFYASGATVFDSSRLGGHTFAQVISFAAPHVVLAATFRGVNQNFSAPFTVAPPDGAPNMLLLATVNASAYSATVSSNVGICLVVTKSG